MDAQSPPLCHASHCQIDALTYDITRQLLLTRTKDDFHYGSSESHSKTPHGVMAPSLDANGIESYRGE